MEIYSIIILFNMWDVFHSVGAFFASELFLKILRTLVTLFFAGSFMRIIGMSVVINHDYAARLYKIRKCKLSLDPRAAMELHGITQEERDRAPLIKHVAMVSASYIILLTLSCAAVIWDLFRSEHFPLAVRLVLQFPAVWFGQKALLALFTYEKIKAQ